MGQAEELEHAAKENYEAWTTTRSQERLDTAIGQFRSGSACRGRSENAAECALELVRLCPPAPTPASRPTRTRSST